jgi:hypothetical protein
MLDVICEACNCPLMETIPHIFDALGGPAKVAVLLGVKKSTANEMKRRKAIRVCYWPALIKVCRDKRIPGVNPSTLMRLHQEVNND